MAEIGSLAGFGKGSLYHHIDNKEGLLYDIASRFIRDLVSTGRAISDSCPDPEERLRRLSQQLMKTIGSNLSEVIVCFREVQALTGSRLKEVMGLHVDYQTLWEQAIADGVNSGVFRPTDKIAVKGLLGMFFYSCLWLNLDGPQTPEEIGEVFSELALRSISI